MDIAMLPFAIFLVFNLPLHVFSKLSPNVTLGSSLTASSNNANNNSWTSPSGDFALGFIQSPGGSGTGYLLAIWFDKIPEKTVVWSANRDNLAPQGSTLQLFSDGSFVLNDPSGKTIWDDATTGGTGVAYGAMLDTGNFVLVSNTSKTLWQSFDTPTDTLLPSQKILTNGNIVPNLSGMNYSSGRFILGMQTDGNLVLYTRNYPLITLNTAYWSTMTFGNNFQLLFNQSGTISVVAQNGTFITSVFSNTVSSNQYYQRLTLDYDGVLRQYVYPKSSTSTGGSPMAWSIFDFLPPNICMAITQDKGGGLCGYNSLCSIGSDQKPACKCPSGYSLIDPNDSMSGCKPDFVSQSCDNDTANFGFNDMPNTDWHFSDFEWFTPVSEDWCRQNCLSDCFCAAAIFNDASCFKKRFPLSNGRTDPSNGGKALMKVRLRNSTTTTDTLSPNVTLGSSLTASNNANNSWTSRSGDFAFGFIQSPGSSGTGPGYLLAIWFNKIPEKTVVWSANRDNLAQQGSTLQLSQDGNFVLNDPTGNSIWADANTRGTGVAYGLLLDTGNFVLVSNNLTILWQSFDTPTDTLLPSQKLLTNRTIVPNLSGTDYSSGRFNLRMQSDGNLVLYIRPYLLSTQNSSYWATMIFGKDFQLVFAQPGPISVVAHNGTFITSVFSDTDLSTQYYQRLTLDYDGVLRNYLYPKSSSSTGGRPMAWSVSNFLPSNICLRINQDTGGGVCGYNSLCSIGDDHKPACKCPLGYSLLVPSDSMSGCKPDFMPQSCDNDSNDKANFGFNDMPNTDWPLTDFEHFTSVTEDWCRQDCLSDCLCAAAIFRDGDCRKKKFPLSNGRTNASVRGKALIKVRQRNRYKKVNSIVIIVESSLLGSSVLVNILLLLAAIFFGHWFSRNSDNTHVTTAANYPKVLPGLNVRSFSYKELEKATNGFNEELGRGSFSVVYKGTLENEDTKLVAVKQLHHIEKRSNDEFNAEVSSISRTNHKNLVQLLGYCNEGQHRLLVYEYMCNGSLASYLFDSNPRPNWSKRVETAFTTARGLFYLHEECSSQIIHCDIKPQNVLLDESLNAKISDFGLAKMLKQDQSKTMTGIRGTRGYVAPEWFRNMAITSKVDVYSFGVLLLEIVCCRKNINTSIGGEKEAILTDWAYDCYEEGKLKLLIKDDEAAQNEMTRVERFVSIAIWCIQEDPSVRPTMKRVVQMLEGSISVSVPPSPSSFISSINLF